MKFESTFRSRRSNVLATRGMVATSQPLAAQAGLRILQSGGNAADAAVCTSAMLNVVEPIMTGVGGDCFVLYWDAEEKALSALNGSGPAPAAASIDELLDEGYTKMPTHTGHTVTVPGAVAAWSALLERHGTMSLADVLQPAIWTAQNGYPVTELIATGWQTQVEKLLRAPDWESDDLEKGPPQPSGEELLLDGRAPRFGELMRIPTLGETFRGIAADGADYVYQGDFARSLSDHVQRYGGWMTPEDMAAYAPDWVEPIAAHYRDVVLYEIPPNSHALLTIVAANVAKGFDVASMEEADRVHVLIECMRVAFAYAHRWICDPRKVDVPLDELCSDAYADRLREHIGLQQAAEMPSMHQFPSPAGSLEGGLEGDTIYLSVVDSDGNACSFINSLYGGTGTGLVVPGTGVSLQNRGALFRLDPEHPNALAPGKRPYHTLMPGMIVRDGELFACFGVMGGHMQPQGHFQMLVNMLDLDHAPQMALNVPRWMIGAKNGDLRYLSPDTVFMEEGWPAQILTDLAQRGHTIEPVSGFSRGRFGGGQIILRDPETGVLIAGSEPRKDGCAVGW
jgi:gamma-glutamyltranspeptidase/glutathione hydrolase